jgi:hypothetical protein
MAATKKANAGKSQRKKKAGAGADSGESKRLVVESPWSQFTSECQRF